MNEIIRAPSVNIPAFAGIVIRDPPLREDDLAYLNQNRLVDGQFDPDPAFAEKATRRKKYMADGGLTVSGNADGFDEPVSVQASFPA